MFAYAALRHPEHAETIARVLAIPAKKFDRALVTWLTEPEVDALLAAPDKATRAGRRDHAMLALAAQTGLRVSELTGLTCGDVHLGTGPHVSCHGKGRKQRITPLTAVTRHRPARLARRTARRPGPAPVPEPHRRTAQPRRRRETPRPARHDRGRRVPLAEGQERHRPHAAAHRRHAPAPRRRRHLGHRPLARPRTGRHHPDLPARRPRTQGESPRQDHPDQTPSPGATSPRTSSSPSSKASDYADLPAGHQAATCRSRREVGITRRSA